MIDYLQLRSKNLVENKRLTQQIIINLPNLYLQRKTIIFNS
jgi:hypothetical protein